jgi:hypothetical protein
MAWVEFEELGDYFAFTAEQFVSKWPHPNTDRIQCDFRMQLGDGPPYPRPGRFILAIEELPDEPDGLAYCFVDMTINGEFRLRGESGVNELGRQVVIDIEQYLDDDYEFSDFPGIEYKFTFEMEGFDDYRVRYFFPWIHPGGFDKDINMLSNNVSNDPIPTVHKDDVSELDLDWPIPPGLGPFSWRAMSECYTFPPPDPPSINAAFNGTDAYVALDHALPGTNNPFILEAQVRFNVIQENPLFGVGSAGGFIGFRDDHDWTHGNIRPDPDFEAELGVWYLVRFEFEQRATLSYDLLVDDVNVWAATANRQFISVNRLGVYRQGVSNTLWSDMDMRDLKWWVGDAPSTDLVLDMPMRVNALDLSDEENHGTPFNMDLPAS